MTPNIYSAPELIAAQARLVELQWELAQAENEFTIALQRRENAAMREAEAVEELLAGGAVRDIDLDGQEREIEEVARRKKVIETAVARQRERVEQAQRGAMGRAAASVGPAFSMLVREQALAFASFVRTTGRVESFAMEQRAAGLDGSFFPNTAFLGIVQTGAVLPWLLRAVERGLLKPDEVPLEDYPPSWSPSNVAFARPGPVLADYIRGALVAAAANGSAA
jgi:hypothetical protein